MRTPFLGIENKKDEKIRELKKELEELKRYIINLKQYQSELKKEMKEYRDNQLQSISPCGD